MCTLGPPLQCLQKQFGAYTGWGPRPSPWRVPPHSRAGRYQSPLGGLSEPIRPPTKSRASKFRHVPQLGRLWGSPTLQRAPGGFWRVLPSFCPATDSGGSKEGLPLFRVPKWRPTLVGLRGAASHFPFPTAPALATTASRRGPESAMGGRAQRYALPRASRPRPASLRPGLERSPVPAARAACRDTRPAQPVLPACAAAARSAFFPRWWRWARGDCRRRQSLNPLLQNLDAPPFSRSRTPSPRSLPPSQAPAILRRCRRIALHLCRPGAHGRGRRRLPRLLIGAALGAAHTSPRPGGPLAPRRGQAAAERRRATSAGFPAAPAPPFPASVSGEGSAGPA